MRLICAKNFAFAPKTQPMGPLEWFLNKNLELKIEILALFAGTPLKTKLFPNQLIRKGGFLEQAIQFGFLLN